MKIIQQAGREKILKGVGRLYVIGLDLRGIKCLQLPKTGRASAVTVAKQFQFVKLVSLYLQQLNRDIKQVAVSLTEGEENGE